MPSDKPNSHISMPPKMSSHLPDSKRSSSDDIKKRADSLLGKPTPTTPSSTPKRDFKPSTPMPTTIETTPEPVSNEEKPPVSDNKPEIDKKPVTEKKPVVDAKPAKRKKVPSKKPKNNAQVVWKHPRMRFRRFVAKWPFLVWLAAVAACVVLYSGSGQFGGMTGIVDTISEPVAPLETARLQSINVNLGQKVKAGDILAQMDTSLVDAYLAEVSADIFESQSSIGNFERSTLTIVKNFESDISNSELSIQDLKRRLERDTAQLKTLETEEKRLAQLLKKGLIDTTQANTLRSQIVVLSHEIKAYPSLITIEKRKLEEAKIGMKNLQKSLRLKDGEDIKEAIRRRAEAQKNIFDAAIKTAQIRKDNYTLRAARDGVVSRIFEQPGNVITAGNSILRLINEETNIVIGFLPEVYLGYLSEGQPVYVMRNGRPERIKGIIQSIAPELDTMPGRISPIRDQPLRGRRVLIEIQEDHNLLPGETVRITNGKSWNSKK